MPGRVTSPSGRATWVMSRASCFTPNGRRAWNNAAFVGTYQASYHGVSQAKPFTT